MAQQTVCINDAQYPDLRVEGPLLEGAGLRVIHANLPRTATPAQVLAYAADCDALITLHVKTPREVVEGLRRCKVISRFAVGYDHVDVETATARGIAVCNAPDYGTEEVANHTMALLLAVARRLPQQDAHLRAGGWTNSAAIPTWRISGQTAGIVGLGRIGAATAARCAAFDMRVLAFDPYLDGTAIRARGAEPASLADVLTQADYLILHCPLTRETRGMIGAAELALLKPTAYLVNCARGAIVQEGPLAEALQAGRLAGAGVDVFSQEPVVAGSPLLAAPNCILTPHTAWYSEQSQVDKARIACENVIEALQGKVPRNIVNPAAIANLRLLQR